MTHVRFDAGLFEAEKPRSVLPMITEVKSEMNDSRGTWFVDKILSSGSRGSRRKDHHKTFEELESEKAECV